jgi:hypothetical protein
MASEPQRETGEPVAFLRIEQKRGKLYLLPYSSLISVELTPESGDDKSDKLELKFASHDVTVTGFHLKELLDGLQKTIRHVIRETSSAKAGFPNQQQVPGNIPPPPIVKSISVDEVGAKVKAGAKA